MEPTQVAIPWLEVMKIALSAGVITALVNQGIAWLRAKQEEKVAASRDAAYLALRVAVMLESYASRCADLISDNDFFDQSSGHAGTSHGTLPKWQPFPVDFDWKVVSSSLAIRALSFENELYLSDRTLHFWYEIDHELLRPSCNEQAGKCGHRALLLAADFRSQYGLPAFAPEEYSWNIRDVLKKHYDAAIKRLLE